MTDPSNMVEKEINASNKSLPPLGAHMSITGGLHKAIERISAVSGTALQVFTRNQRQWKVPEIADQDLGLFTEAWEKWGPHPIAAHDSYLINLANPDPDKARKSMDGFAMELARCERLNIPSLTTHPGSHLGQGVEQGIRLYVERLDTAVEESATERTMVLLETTAGQGTNLGSTFEELGEIISLSKHPDRLGVCFDTCHAFCAGYDIISKEAYAHTFSEFDRIVGIERIGLFHLNDSKNPLGSKKDRHEHIGKGHLGTEPFHHILNDARFRTVPMVLETPKDKDDELKRDRENLATLMGLVAE